MAPTQSRTPSTNHPLVVPPPCLAVAPRPDRLAQAEVRRRAAHAVLVAPLETPPVQPEAGVVLGPAAVHLAHQLGPGGLRRERR